MKRAVIRRKDNFRNWDCKRIVQIFADRDIYISENDAEEVWGLYSDSMCAGWISLPEDDDDVFQMCSLHVDILDDFEEE